MPAGVVVILCEAKAAHALGKALRQRTLHPHHCPAVPVPEVGRLQARPEEDRLLLGALGLALVHCI